MSRKKSLTKTGIIIKKQGKFCSELLRQTKEKCFSDISVKIIYDNQKIWKTIKNHFFPIKV